MPVEAFQYQWLSEFTNGAVRDPAAGPDAAAAVTATVRSERATEQARKKTLLDGVWQRLDAQADAIRTACGLQAPQYKSGTSGKTETAQLRAPDGRQENAIESARTARLADVPKRPGAGVSAVVREGTSADGTGFKMHSSDLHKAGDAMDKVGAERAVLASAMTPRTHLVDGMPETKQERLFTDDEIGTLLYEPLVRAKIIPETLVPNTFSQTRKMIDGSNQYYLNECKAKGGADRPTGRAALAKDLVAAGTAMAAGALTALGPVMPGKDAIKLPHGGPKMPQLFSGYGAMAEATDYAVAGGAAAALAIDGASLVDDILHSDDSLGSAWQSVLNDAGLAAGKVFSVRTGNPHIGLAVADLVSGVASAANFLAEWKSARKKGGAFPLDTLVAQLGTAIAAPFRRWSDLNGEKPSADAARIGDAIEAFLKSAAAGIRNRLDQAIAAGDWTAVKACLVEMVTICAKAVPNEALLDVVTAEDGDFYQVEKRAEGQGKAIDAITGAGDAILARAGTMKAGPGNPVTTDGKRLAAAAAKVEEQFKQKQDELSAALKAKQVQEADAIETRLAQEQERFEASLASLTGGTGDDGMLARMYEQLERDQKTWDMAFAVMAAVPGITGGVYTAVSPLSEALGPIKGAVQAVSFCANLKAAIQRGAAWQKWKASQQDAEIAVSPYATAIDNFVGNQRAQMMQHSAQAFGNMIQGVLAFFELSPMLPAFKVAGAVAGAVFSAEQAIYRYHHEKNLRAAWAKTKEAFDPKNQGDRVMGLMVRKLNPTLAKYTLAYGALVAKSPIAITAMNRIGIDRDTLENERDGVAALKTYLEKLYPEDGVVTGLFDPVSRQRAPSPALSVKTWSMTYMFWTKHMALATRNPPKVTGLLGLVESLYLDWGMATAATGPGIAAKLQPMLSKLRGALIAFEPVTQDGKPIPAITDAVRAYVALVDDMLTEVAAAPVPAGP